MPTLNLSVSYDSPAELVDALEELRHLWDSFEDGAVDLGPVLRASCGSWRSPRTTPSAERRVLEVRLVHAERLERGGDVRVLLHAHDALVADGHDRAEAADREPPPRLERPVVERVGLGPRRA